MVEAFNNALSFSGFTGVSAKMFDGKLRFVSDDPTVQVKVLDTSTELGLSMTGLTDVSPVEVKDIDGNVIGSMTQGYQAKAETGISFTFNLDGVQKEITLNQFEVSIDNGGKITEESLYKALKSEVKKAFGDYVNVAFEEDGSGGKRIGLNLNFGGEEGHQLTVTGSDASYAGITPGASTHIGNNTRLGELGLTGSRYTFTLNGKTFTFDENDSVGSMINQINNSDIGIRISYSTLSDTFKMESTSTGSNYNIELTQTEGNLFSVLFGEDKVASAESAASKELTTDYIQGTELEDSYTAASVNLRFCVDDQLYSFSIAAKENTRYSKSYIEQSFNLFLAKTFGPAENGTDMKISFEDGKLNIKDGLVVRFEQSSVDLEDAAAVDKAIKNGDLGLAFGFTQKAATNVATKDTPLDELGLDGLDLRDKDGLAATDLASIAKINGHDVVFKDGRFVLKGGNVDLSSAADEKLAKLFGADSLTLSDGQTSAGAVLKGEDAKVIINGVETTRSSNTFTLDGITMELTQKSGEIKDASGNVTSYEETVISTARDIDKIVDGFKNFVDDYNKMIEKLNKYIDEDPNYKTYAPLTDEQKKEMSDREIELWEEKAKQGLIRNDSVVSQFLSEMRTILYTKPAGAKYALYGIGIETGEAKQKGKLILDEATLRKALSTDPNSVQQLFTDATDGIAAKMVTSIKRAANLSIGSPGSLVSLAGMTGWSDKNNTLTKNITSIESRIKQLQTQYEKERARYWNQFNSMESILANYNSQMNMITQMSGGSY